MAANTVSNRHEITMERARTWARDHGSLASLPGRDDLAEALRRLIRRNRLTDAELDELTKLGLSLDRRADNWREGLRRFAAFRANRGHVNVPARYVTEDGYRLGAWAHWQKQRVRLGHMRPWQRDILAGLGLKLPEAH